MLLTGYPIPSHWQETRLWRVFFHSSWGRNQRLGAGWTLANGFSLMAKRPTLWCGLVLGQEEAPLVSRHGDCNTQLWLTLLSRDTIFFPLIVMLENQEDRFPTGRDNDRAGSFGVNLSCKTST